MGVFYLRHPKHGTKVATQEDEVEHDKKRGWLEFDPNAERDEEPIEPLAPRRGRPPKDLNA